MDTEATGAGAKLLLERLRRQTGPSAPDEPALVATGRDTPLPLSFAQRRLWLLDRMRPGGSDYVVPFVLLLRGDLSRLPLGHALDVLVRRHEILRTRYVTDDAGEPMQVVDPPAPRELPVDDLTGAGRPAVEAALDAEIARPFDLAAGPVLRTRLIRVAPDEHLLTIVAHHIAVDGWSGGLILRELSALCAGADLPPPVLQYGDFAAWQRTHLSGERADGGLRYWTQRLRGLPRLELPTDRPRPPVWDGTGTTVAFDIPADVTRRVAAIARERRLTPYMVHLSALWSLLHRWTGQTDFAVTSPIAGRTRSETEHLVGFFVNMLVLRADLGGDPTFAEVLARARDTAVEAYSHQDVPFESIVEALAPERDLSTHPLVNVNLTLQNNEPLRFAAAGVTGEMVPRPARQAKFDLGWTLEERPDGSTAGEVTFPYALLDEATVRRMADQFVRLLAAAVAEPDTTIGDLPLMDPAELAALTRPALAPSRPAARGLHDRFAVRAAAHPEAIAVSAEGRHVSYRDLDRAANRLAHRLRALGVDREDLVGVCLPRGVDMLVALLAILKAGAAYLPLDPDYPAERTDFLVRDADARVVIVDAAAGRGFAGARLVALDDPDERARIDAEPGDAPAVHVDPDNLAYVIYTSGSTGRPKGVQVTHANVIRLFSVTRDEFRFGPDDVWALFHSYAFDFSVWEMWGPLLHGGRLVVVPYAVSRSPWDLVTLLADEGVTVLNQTPSAFRSMVELAVGGEPALDRLRLRLVIFGGEALDVPGLAPWWRRFGDTGPRLVNMYGITETTVHVTCRPLSPADLEGARSPVGGPLADLTMYVLDGRMRPVPLGAPGELYVGGAGVARGYLGRPALTAARFVPDPFGPPGSRLYRTGDKARMLPGGDTAFLGRMDDQVKIRGFRIEPGEIESCLAAHPDVDAAVVVVHESAPGDRQLAAYVVPAAGSRVTVAAVRSHAADRLPGYLVPPVIVLIPELPLTASGKVDRAALPDPGGLPGEPRDEHVAPRTTTEAAVARLWSEVLGGVPVGVHTSFFALGGDSIRAVRLVGMLRAAGFPYSVQDLFRHQTVAELVAAGGGAPDPDETGTLPFALIDAADRARVPAGIEDAYPMAQAQVGMVYELLADQDVKPYHNITSYLIRDTGRFDSAALIVAIDEVVAEHEILRTSFDLATFSVPMQLVHTRPTAELGHEDLRGLTPDEQEARMAAFRDLERARTFALDSAPLFRIHAHQTGDDRWFLSLTEFHAILDGWSHNSLISELLARYRRIRDGGPRPAAEVRRARYADFIAAERRSLAGSADREFWLRKLDDGDRLTLPAAWADPDGPGEYRVAVPYADLADDLRALAAAAGGSMKSVLLTAHLAVWQSVAGERRFFSGLVCNGRTEAEGGDLVRGMFLNPVPFLAPAATGSWRDLVRAVFAEEVALWPHRRFPMAELQRLSGGGDRLVEVAFNYLDFHVLDRQMVDTSGSTDVSPNEFPLAVSTQGGKLMITALSARIGRDHAELLGRMYRSALELMAARPDSSARAGLLPADARTALLDLGRSCVAAADGPPVHESAACYARAHPDRPALEAAGVGWTYGELFARSAAWAGTLAATGVGRGDLVGLCLPREPDLVAAMLGVLRLGAAYVPVDPGHPPARTAATLQAAGVRAVVMGAADPGGLAGRLSPVPVLTAPEPGAEPDARTPDPDDLAYVVHTSGSTGRPKGVMASHGGIAGRVASLRRTLMLTEQDTIVLVVPTTTDVAQLAVFAALVSGGRVVLAGEHLVADPATLAALLRDSGATMMQAAPTTWRMLVESGWHPPAGFRLLSGGESLTDELVRRLCDTGAEVWDNYGPSEVTVFCFGTRLSGPGSPRWQPADGSAAYLLDDRLEPVLPGVSGHLFVGGAGLARGYLNGPRATADAFRPDPWAPTPGARMYATGDVARRGDRNRLEILGRRDHQVKIRGYRIELGDIENTLARHPGVRAVVVHPVPGPRLAAYVLAADPAVTADDLRRHADDTLPEYMVPAHFVFLDAFPRLPNGKIDRRALPVPDHSRPDVGIAYRPPEGPVESALADVVADVLGVDKVGRDDDFYALGGHSLLTLRVIARLRRDHGVEVTFRDFLLHRTVRALAASAVNRPAPQTRPPALLRLGAAGHRTPLYCLHPGGGSARWYLDLADRFAPDRPLVAFEWPGLHGDFGTAGSVADIAATYLKELRAAQPHGPYHLLGWCGSSGIAWEMARRLHAAGERPHLILLDPTVDTSVRDNTALLSNVELFRRAENLFRKLRDGSGEKGHDVRAELVSVLGGVVDDGDIVFDEADLDDSWAHRLHAWRELLEVRLHYRFPRYPGSVDLVLCEELASDRYEAILTQRFDDYLTQWQRLAAGGIRIHQVPGDHRGALRPPHVSTLAATLAAIIDRPDPKE